MNELQQVRMAIDALHNVETEIMERYRRESADVRNEVIAEHHKDDLRWKRTEVTYTLMGLIEYTNGESLPKRDHFTQDPNHMTELLREMTERVQAIESAGEKVVHLEIGLHSSGGDLDVEANIQETEE